MPALKMRIKSRTKSVRGRNIRACRKSNNIPEELRSQVKTTQQAAVLDTSIQIHHNVSSNIERSNQNIQNTEANDCQAIFSGASVQPLKFPLSPSDSAVIEKMVSLSATFPPTLESIFSPVFEHNESQFKTAKDSNAVSDYEHPELPQLVSVDGKCTASNAQSCNFWDFYTFEVAASPFDGDTGFSDITSACQDYEHIQLDMTFDKADKSMVLPSLEKTVEISSIHDDKSSEEAAMSSDESCFYSAIHQMTYNPDTEISYKHSDLEEVECFDPQLFLRSFPDLSEANFPSLLPKETRKRKHITLVLDLDETLVHSTLEHCDDADFTFPVFFNMKEHTVYVRRRPHLQIFLERVSHMFELVIFTASQSIYAEQLLDTLDPDRKLISQRIYRESCIFSDGTYTKDLTILGVDLAKVAIIDNSPQVFRLQVNNGIPIKSWFNDPTDQALISLLPFLETLVDADDVRPIIAKRFGNKE